MFIAEEAGWASRTDNKFRDVGEKRKMILGEKNVKGLTIWVFCTMLGKFAFILRAVRYYLR